MRCSEGSDKFLLFFYKVATKWLGHCLACFLWTKQAKHSKQDSKERYSQASSQKAAMYTRDASLVGMPQPLWDWWKARVDVNGGLTEIIVTRPTARANPDMSHTSVNEA